MKKKYTVTYQKMKYLHYDVEAENEEEAIELANEEDEKFGMIIETPYFLASVREKEE